jgi:uncharacterized protein (DUF3084 family)
MRTDH